MKAVDSWTDGLETGFDALRTAEVKIFGAAPPPRPFRRIGQWILAEDVAADRGTNLMRQIFPRPLLLAPLRLRLSPRLMVQSRSSAILLKSNLRAFYPQDRLTAKIANPLRAHALARLRNERAQRRNLRDTQRVLVPKMQKDNEPAAGFIVEELIEARPLREVPLPPAALAEQLVEFQLANAPQIADAKQDFAPQRTLALLANWLTEQSMAGNEGLLRDLERLLARSSLPVAITLCNNDLTWSNVLRTGDDRLYIVDWEYAGRAPCFVDAVRLATQIEGYAAAYQHAYTRQRPTAGQLELAPKEQLLLAALLVCGQRIERRGDFPDAADRAAYERRLKKRLVRFLGLMHSLLD